MAPAWPTPVFRCCAFANSSVVEDKNITGLLELLPYSSKNTQGTESTLYEQDALLVLRAMKLIVKLEAVQLAEVGNIGVAVVEDIHKTFAAVYLIDEEDRSLDGCRMSESNDCSSDVSSPRKSLPLSAPRQRAAEAVGSG